MPAHEWAARLRGRRTARTRAFIFRPTLCRAVRRTRGQRAARCSPRKRKLSSVQHEAKALVSRPKLNPAQSAKCSILQASSRSSLAAQSASSQVRLQGQGLAHRLRLRWALKWEVSRVASIGSCCVARGSSCSHSLARPNTSIERTPNIRLRLLSVAAHVER